MFKSLTTGKPVLTIRDYWYNQFKFRHLFSIGQDCSASHYEPRKAPSLIKQDLIQRVVERTGLPRIKAESAVDAIFEAMKGALTNSDRIELRGFGVFTVKPRKTGVGRNPRTGAEVSITPGKAVRFKPGKDLQLID
jgi:nucleoid DNA-binding protein